MVCLVKFFLCCSGFFLARIPSHGLPIAFIEKYMPRFFQDTIVLQYSNLFLVHKIPFHSLPEEGSACMVLSASFLHLYQFRFPFIVCVEMFVITFFSKELI